MEPLVIVGAGDQGEFVADTVRAARSYSIIGFIDDEKPVGFSVADSLVLGKQDHLQQLRRDGIRYAFVAIGCNRTRRTISEALTQWGFETPVIRHPLATVATSATIDRGVLLLPGSIVSVGASVGEGVILNNACSVEHHSKIAPWAHIGPRALVGARCHIGTLALVGVGAITLNNLDIGAGAIVGAGSVVTKNVAEGVTVVGSPARVLRTNLSPTTHLSHL